MPLIRQKMIAETLPEVLQQLSDNDRTLGDNVDRLEKLVMSQGWTIGWMMGELARIDNADKEELGDRYEREFNIAFPKEDA